MISWRSSFASSLEATSANVTFGRSSVYMRARLWPTPKASRWPVLAWYAIDPRRKRRKSTLSGLAPPPSHWKADSDALTWTLWLRSSWTSPLSPGGSSVRYSEWPLYGWTNWPVIWLPRYSALLTLSALTWATKSLNGICDWAPAPQNANKRLKTKTSTNTPTHDRSGTCQRRLRQIGSRGPRFCASKNLTPRGSSHGAHVFSLGLFGASRKCSDSADMPR